MNVELTSKEYRIKQLLHNIRHGVQVEINKFLENSVYQLKLFFDRKKITFSLFEFVMTFAYLYVGTKTYLDQFLQSYLDIFLLRPQPRSR